MAAQVALSLRLISYVFLFASVVFDFATFVSGYPPPRSHAVGDRQMRILLVTVRLSFLSPEQSLYKP